MTEGEHLELDEVVQAIRNLSVADKTRVMKNAMYHARKTPYRHRHDDDVFQESMLRVLDGRRRWPRGFPAVPFLSGVAASIAWEWRIDPDEKPAHVSDPHTQENVSDPHAQENDEIAKLDEAKLTGLFEDDLAAKTLVVGILQGARGEELQRLSGLNQKEYETKRRKIRRRIEKSSMWKR